MFVATRIKLIQGKLFSYGSQKEDLIALNLNLHTESRKQGKSNDFWHRSYAKNIVTYLWIFEWHEEGEVVTLQPMFQVLMQENVGKLEAHVRRTGPAPQVEKQKL